MPTPAQVQLAVDQLSNVGKLVHLAWRQDSVAQQDIAGIIFRRLRDTYEDEMTRNAERVGCGGQRGLLQEGPAMSELRATADEHAASIVRTYNLDLSRAIAAIRTETPTANRNTFSSRLQEWESARAQWKDGQIGLMTYSTGAQMAKSDFTRLNNLSGTAEVIPKTAAEERCQALIDAGEVSIRVAEENPFPLHFNCIHEWILHPEKVLAGECRYLYMG